MDGRAARLRRAVAALWPYREQGRRRAGHHRAQPRRLFQSFYFGLNHFPGRPANDTTILMAANDGMRRAESMVIIRRCGWF